MDTSLHGLGADVSELEYNRLGKRIHVTCHGLDMQFTEQTGALVKALERGQRVLLKGTFFPSMNDALHELIMSRQQGKEPRGGLPILLSQEANSIALLPSWGHEVTYQEKRIILGTTIYSDKEDAQYSQAQLRVMRRYQAIHPGKDPKQAWLGMVQLPPSAKSPFLGVGVLEQERVHAVEEVFRGCAFCFFSWENRSW